MAKFLGYRNRATVFTVRTPEGIKTITSNACRYEDAFEKVGFKNEWAKDMDSYSFRLLDGKGSDEFHTEVIWAVEGTIPSGKATVEYLHEIGAVTDEELEIIKNSKEVRL